MKRFDEYIESYFEGTINEEELNELTEFLCSDDSSDKKYDEIKAVMSYFSVASQKYKAKKRKAGERLLLWSSAATIALFVTISLTLQNNRHTYVNYIYGEKTSDAKIVMDEVDNIMTDIFANETKVDHQLENILKNK